MALTWISTNYFGFNFGESEKVNLFVYGIICIAIAVIRFFDGFTEFQTKQELMKAMKEVTEHKEEADKANAAKGIFLAHMSHEIRTPINTILGMDELILRESSEENIKQYSANIKRSGKTLLMLVDDILDFSKIDAGKMEVTNTPYKLSDALVEMIIYVQNSAKEKELDFHADINPVIPQNLFGDETRIKQIVTNLLTNAVKYTNKGSITLKVEYRKNTGTDITLIISVKDTGIGIRKEDIDKLFDPFNRIEENKHRSIEGTGLGLSITKELIDLLQGSIQIESQYGQGSNFTVEIPQRILNEEPIGDF